MRLRLLAPGLPLASKTDPEIKGDQAYIKPERIGVNRETIRENLR